MGKPFGNGHPLAAVLVVNPHLAHAFVKNCGVELFNTTGGSTLSCAVGLAVIKSVVDDNLIQNSEIVGSYFVKKLCDLKQKL